MAWHCNGTTNQEMVTKLKDAGILATDRAEAAMLAVDRAKYCHEPDPYLDRPRRIGYNVTISAPHMHAYALSILSDQLADGAKALDVGSGSGYLSACMAFMVGSRGRVIGIEHIPELIEISTRNVREDNPHFLKEDRIKFVVGDGRLGHPADGPYNAIHVGAAAEALPQTCRLRYTRWIKRCSTLAVDRPTGSRRPTDLPGRGHRRPAKVPRPAAGGQERGRRDHEEETDASLLRSSHGSHHSIT
ncbi:PREDICTED: protein-L-isoaspartate(D-aspartate) O-methyltransferase-like isoform X2 [Wasmannia auropunctata]|uniref:protein-L-isoaspartate(D-aspartate) O-methyltransferase-like isoform X2 n=1 Tax=Wasmannia auropunctata TaxID=64793 RepID=UPI0005EE0EA5|nr:PREDICTED: protein-L-isoaspartate(D-aspartate) O-methyltransferase-like isoform X2 [Wasmannia auropunctata]